MINACQDAIRCIIFESERPPGWAACFLFIRHMTKTSDSKRNIPPEDFHYQDSRFADVDGLQVHYRMAGQGEPGLLLFHGFGANTFTWRKIMQPISRHGATIAYDRPAFGLTERPDRDKWPGGENPYSPEFQPRLAISLLDALSIDQAVLIGNSAGGTIAMLTAYNYPERVAALILVDAAIYTTGGTPEWFKPILGSLKRLPIPDSVTRPALKVGKRLLKVAWHDPTRIESDVIDGYATSWQVDGWDRAMWEMISVTGPMDISWVPPRIKTPTLVITGDDDRIVPTAESIRLAEEIPGAELVVIPECGHMPQEECPWELVEAAGDFIDRVA